jgi:hypothetical protein
VGSELLIDNPDLNSESDDATRVLVHHEQHPVRSQCDGFAAHQMVTDKTIVVPGHGPVGGKTEMIEYRDILTAIRDRVAALKGEGKSLDEIVAAKPTAAYDAKWGGFFINGEFLYMRDEKLLLTTKG